MTKSEREQQNKAALEQGLHLLKPLLLSARDPFAAMNDANRVQEHYRKALRCPVCADTACETKSNDCGT